MCKRNVLVIIGAALMLALWGCGGGSDTPEGIITSIYTQIQKGNYKKGTRMMYRYSIIKSNISEKDFIKSEAERHKKIDKKKGELKSFEIVSNEVSEYGEVKVRVKSTYGNGNEDCETFRFVKRDGKWKINHGLF
jgi:hypothetical protein